MSGVTGQCAGQQARGADHQRGTDGRSARHPRSEQRHRQRHPEGGVLGQHPVGPGHRDHGVGVAEQVAESGARSDRTG